MAELAVGRDVHLRVGQEVLKTIDSVRLRHVVDLARSTGKEWPILEWLAAHPDGEEEIDWQGLVDEMQRLALERPPEHVAPLIGNLRNDAGRAAGIAGRR